MKEPKVSIQEPKIKPDVKVKDTQKTQKKPPEKEKTADVKELPDKPQKTLLDPSQINISKSVVKGQAPQKPIPVVKASDIASSLKAIQSQVAVSADSTDVPIDYYDTVSSYLYRLWKQPSKAELKGLRPSVTITMSVSGNGSVRSARISSRSGNQPMDRSVSELLGRLKIIPAPPDGREIEISVTLVIVD
jgi:TonB family protein